MKKTGIFLKVLILALGISIIACYGVNYNCFYAKKLISAIDEENVDKVQEIVSKHPKCVNAYPQTLPEKIVTQICQGVKADYPLMRASRKGNEKIVRCLLEAGADVNYNIGYTALSLTYCNKENNWYQTSLYLIEAGADINYITRYYDQTTVLEDIVQARPGSKVAGYVPEEEEEVNASFYYVYEHCDHSKVSWIGVAKKCVYYNRLEILQFLFDEGYLDINAVDVNGYSILMYAAENASTETVEFLLDKGAEKYFVDANGKTAYDYALEHEKMDNAELLKCYMEETQEVSTQEPFVREMSESPYYRIYQGATMEDRFYYYYDLFDADGNQVDHTCTYMADPQISEVSDHVLRISAQAGTGRGCIWFYYYDVNENRSSVPHDYPLAQKAPLVAYFDGKHVIVSDMFDPESYYKEIVLDNEFSNSIEPVLDAEFSEDLSHLMVLYESGEECRVMREIVDL